MTQLAPFGSWKSPITADLIVQGTVTLDGIVLDGDDLYWLEGRPSEEGRYSIVKLTPDGSRTDVLAAPFNARTRVHEYGGGAYTVNQGILYFANFADQRLYQFTANETPTPLTPDLPLRYADFVVDQPRNRLIGVREDHRQSDQEATNTIVSVSTTNENEGKILCEGADFYAYPRLSPDGSQLAWIQWNHPNMPWDGCELWLATLNEDGSIANQKLIAGTIDESIFQPEWSPDGQLYFISDRSGWWNLYRFSEGQIESICERRAEFGEPLWRLGARTYAFVDADNVVCTFHEVGRWQLATLAIHSGELQPLELPTTDYGSLQATSTHALCVTGSPRETTAITRIDLKTGQREILQRSSSVSVDDGFFSIPQSIEFPTENELTAHAFYYPPTNKDYQAPTDEKPPLLVCSHGGPTGATSSTLKLTIQYWTSRGFAVVDVNYGGSTGYGRAYRERLKEKWGIVDIDDCCNAALYLVNQGLADEQRLAIRGGSAGGYTTLGALTFRDVFAAGASHFGVSDLEALVKETHKFESRYLDGLIGPFPEAKAIYDERAPIHHTEKLSCPVILFQGLEDAIVLPNQAEMMVDALREKGIPVAYLPFEGEQHGFRQAKNIKRCLEAELYFYSKIFHFNTAEPIEPVNIENLDD